ncbi:MAG TPA: DoxX family protein [Burkholderiales bacterium]
MQTDIADLIGRIALAVIFIFSGADKLFLHTAANVQYMQAVGMPLAGLLVYPAGLAEFAGGVLLAIGYRARIAAALLAAFTVVATALFHAFWAAPADQALLQTVMFLKNLAMFGGLLHVVAHGTGRLALAR